MPETDQAGARLLLARLEQRLREDSRVQGWPVSISVGLADNQASTRPLDALIAEADRRMYFAKSTRP
jgi:GGDEF domain-containing protein